jgi:hypothetical protein
MDDYSLTSLSESKNEWCARLVNSLTPALIQGFSSIFNEAHKLCQENDEVDKYLMTFQNFLSRVPKWNEDMIDTERKRIEENSNCGYLEDLITCVHIIQLKALSCVRVGQKQKKVDIDIPSANKFIHKCYSNVARKIYTNVYLFEKDLVPLQIQKHNRELEVIIKECILNSVRESMPVEQLLRAYMDETEEVNVEVHEELINTPLEVENLNVDNKVTNDVSEHEVQSDNIENVNFTHNPETVSITKSDKIAFSDIDKAVDVTGNETNIEAPKTIERLEKIAHENAEKRRLEEEEEDDDDDDKIKIGSTIDLESMDINDLNKPSIKVNDKPILDDIEVLV